MGLRLKFNLVLLFVFILGLGVSGYVSYDLLHKTARDEVLRNGARPSLLDSRHSTEDPKIESA